MILETRSRMEMEKTLGGKIGIMDQVVRRAFINIMFYLAPTGLYKISLA